MPVREPAVVVRGLRKTYGDVEAVAGIDLTIDRGEVFALLGPNGAGKTTTVEILEGYRRRTGGEVVGARRRSRDRRPRPTRTDRDRPAGVRCREELTLREVIVLYSAAYPEPLAARRDGRAWSSSRRSATRASGRSPAASGGGSTWRSGSPATRSSSSSTSPRPASTRPLGDVPGSSFKRLRSLGKTILLTTHYMEEAQYLADRVAVIAAGRIVADGTPETLAGRDHDAALVRFRMPDGSQSIGCRCRPRPPSSA